MAFNELEFSDMNESNDESNVRLLLNSGDKRRLDSRSFLFGARANRQRNIAKDKEPATPRLPFRFPIRFCITQAIY